MSKTNNLINFCNLVAVLSNENQNIINANYLKGYERIINSPSKQKRSFITQMVASLIKNVTKETLYKQRRVTTPDKDLLCKITSIGTTIIKSLNCDCAGLVKLRPQQSDDKWFEQSEANIMALRKVEWDKQEKRKQV